MEIFLCLWSILQLSSVAQLGNGSAVSDIADDIATIAYSELDILKRQLQSITMTLPSATSDRQESQLGLIVGIAGTLFNLFNYINTPEYNEQIKRNK